MIIDGYDEHSQLYRDDITTAESAAEHVTSNLTDQRFFKHTFFSGIDGDFLVLRNIDILCGAYMHLSLIKHMWVCY